MFNHHSFAEHLYEEKNSNDNEYYKVIKQFYSADPNIAEEIIKNDKMGVHYFKKIETKKSNSGNLYIRYADIPQGVFILAIIAKDGSISREDVPDLRMWLDKLKVRMREGKQVQASVNSMSEPILMNTVKDLEREGLHFEIEKHADVISFGKGKEWGHIVITPLAK